MKLDGQKTRLGLVLSSASVLFAEGSKLFDSDAATMPDWTVVGPALVVGWGAAHAIWKDYQAAKATKAAEARAVPAPSSIEGE